MNSYLEPEEWVKLCLTVSSSSRRWWISHGQARMSVCMPGLCQNRLRQPCFPLEAGCMPSQMPGTLVQTEPLTANSPSAEGEDKCASSSEDWIKTLYHLYWKLSSETLPQGSGLKTHHSLCLFETEALFLRVTPLRILLLLWLNQGLSVI